VPPLEEAPQPEEEVLPPEEVPADTVEPEEVLPPGVALSEVVPLPDANAADGDDPEDQELDLTGS
jgi:hypothetical protein